MTNVGTHFITAGDSSPIKQPTRHIPFALRNKTEQLVDDDTEESCTSMKEPLGKFSCDLSLLMPRMEKQDSVGK